MSIDSARQSGPRRRTLLATAAGGAALLLSACTADSDPAAGSGDSPAATRLRNRQAEASAALLRAYRETAQAHPSLADRLTPLQTATAEHVSAFGGRADPESGTALPSPSRSASRPASGPTSGAASGTPAAGSGPRAPGDVPGTPQKALAALAAAERRLADERTAALTEAPPELARLLASVAAADAAHAYLLGSGG